MGWTVAAVVVARHVSRVALAESVFRPYAGPEEPTSWRPNDAFIEFAIDSAVELEPKTPRTADFAQWV